MGDAQPSGRPSFVHRGRAEVEVRPGTRVRAALGEQWTFGTTDFSRPPSGAVPDPSLAGVGSIGYLSSLSMASRAAPRAR